MNKASGGDRIPVKLFQILKDDAVKCCIQYASKFGKLSNGYRTGKGQFSFQSQRKAMPKNVQLPHNCTHLTRQQSNAQSSLSQASIVLNREFPDVQAGFRKGRGNRAQMANIHWIIKKAREFQKNIFCFIDYTKGFDCVDHNKLENS